MRSWILCAFLLFAGCKIDQSRPIQKDRLRFAVVDDAELFFKNVRQIYYDVQTLPAASTTVYRHPDRMPDEAQPALWPAIVLSPLEDEAKILIEHNEVLENEAALRIAITIQKQTKDVVLTARGRDQMLEFATTIYEGIQQNAIFAVYVGGEPIPWLANEEQRQAFRSTMADFYRLTGAL